MQLFYEPDLLESNFLSEMESKHCVKVLRKKAGDVIHVIDGKGNLIEAEVKVAHHKKCELTILDVQKEFEKRNYFLHLAIAPTKNMDRIEWCIEKAVEIGVDEISFLKCENSERSVVKLERIDRIVVSAMKQSLKAYKPKVNEIESFKTFVSTCTNMVKLIAHLEEADKKYISNFEGDDYCMLIGPEGDFSPQEIGMAIDSGFQSVSLGASRLRTETAGVTSVNEISLLHRD